MKALTLIAFATAMLATPAFAQITDVDHPDIPNCVIFPKSGHNAPNCETLTIQAVYANNGKGGKFVTTNPVTKEKTVHYSW